MTVVYFSTGRRDGDSRAAGALSRILQKHGWPPHSATAEQVHGARLAIVPELKSSKKFPGADGLLTDQPHQPLGIFTADCVPLFLSADGGRVVGMLHAGWRGVQARILQKAVQVLRHRWRIAPGRVEIWPGPAIGPCCFEVQWDVASHFPQSRQKKKDRWTVDLIRELRYQARQLGIHWVGKRALQGCTMHQSRFHSFRRDHTNKRQVSVIMRTDESTQ